MSSTTPSEDPDPNLDGLDPDETVWVVKHNYLHTGDESVYHTERECTHLQRSPHDPDDKAAQIVVPHARICKACSGETPHGGTTDGPKVPCPACGSEEILFRHLPCDGNGGEE